jgi:hypothetical protein
MAWLRCGPTSAWHTIVHGRSIVDEGRLTHPALPERLALHTRHARRIQLLGFGAQALTAKCCLSQLEGLLAGCFGHVDGNRPTRLDAGPLPAGVLNGLVQSPADAFECFTHDDYLSNQICFSTSTTPARPHRRNLVE